MEKPIYEVTIINLNEISKQNQKDPLKAVFLINLATGRALSGLISVKFLCNFVELTVFMGLLSLIVSLLIPYFSLDTIFRGYFYFS